MANAVLIPKANLRNPREEEVLNALEAYNSALEKNENPNGPAVDFAYLLIKERHVRYDLDGQEIVFFDLKRPRTEGTGKVRRSPASYPINPLVMNAEIWLRWYVEGSRDRYSTVVLPGNTKYPFLDNVLRRVDNPRDEALVVLVQGRMVYTAKLSQVNGVDLTERVRLERAYTAEVKHLPLIDGRDAVFN